MKLKTIVFIAVTIAYVGLFFMGGLITYYTIINQFYLTAFPSILFLIGWSVIYIYWLSIGFKIRKLEKQEQNPGMIV